MWIKRARDQNKMEQHSITPEALHTLLASNQEVLVFDVRQPLDLLADPEIIVGAKRIPPPRLDGESNAHPEREGLGRLLYLSR